MDFKFERNRIDKIPREKIIEELVNVSEKYNYTRFTSKEFLENASIGHQTVFREFGTWEAAMECLTDYLKQKGITLKSRTKPKRKDAYTQKQLFDEMQRIWGQLGHRPSKDEWERVNPKINYNTVRRHFNGWTNACQKFIEYVTGENLEETTEAPITVSSDNVTKVPLSPENSRNIPLGIRLKVLARDNFRCILCGRSPATDIGVKLHIDHITPFSKGGTTIYENLQTLCFDCNLGKSNGDILNLMNNDFVKQGYNKAAEDYASKRNQFENDKYLEKLNELLDSHSSILDIGCGAGKPVDSFFVSKGHKVTGIDLSEKMIELAKQNVPEAEYKIEDMTMLKNGEYKVDAVVSFYAIFHTPRETHKELFNKINSFLSASGYLLITMGSSEWEGKEEDFHGAEMYWSHYDSKKNRELVEQASFEVLIDEIDGTGGEKHQVILARKI